MTTNENDGFAQRADEVMKAGKARYGASFDAALSAIKQTGGIPEAAMRDVVARDDAPDLLYRAGVEQLVNLADNDPAAEQAYRKIRSAQREEHRKSKGGR